MLGTYVTRPIRSALKDVHQIILMEKPATSQSFFCLYETHIPSKCNKMSFRRYLNKDSATHPLSRRQDLCLAEALRKRHRVSAHHTLDPSWKSTNHCTCPLWYRSSLRQETVANHVHHKKDRPYLCHCHQLRHLRQVDSRPCKDTEEQKVLREERRTKLREHQWSTQKLASGKERKDKI